MGYPTEKARPTVMLPVPPDFLSDGIPFKAGMNQPFVRGVVESTIGPIAHVSSELTGADRWGNVKARWGVGRMQYSIDPGLYALGSPDENSPVFVTANYKMSFDRLRKSLAGRDGWILVLDTKGINVWCAAGKGTFGTVELVRRIYRSGLDHVIAHRVLILPQLSAPGVSAHQVKSSSGFSVLYGPVRAEDLPAYLDAGYRALPEMRRKSFTMAERSVLIPIELVEAVKAALMIIPLFFLIGGITGSGFDPSRALREAGTAAAALSAAVVAGAILTPLILPTLPGRAFSLKGCLLGILAALVFSAFSNMRGWIDASAWFLMITAVSAYLAMNFTGASTFTSISGVKKEMRYALPLEIAGGLGGLLLWIASLWNL